MTIEKLKSGSYRLTQMYEGKRYRTTIDHKPSQKEAIQLMSKILDNVPKASRMSFQKASGEYNRIKSNVLSPSTLKDYSNMCDRMSKDFISKDIYAITKADVQKEINDYSVGRSPKTVRNLNAYIMAVLKAFREDFKGYTITLPQQVNKEPYIPSTEDVKRIIDASIGTEYEIILKLACFGLRRSEAICITSDDLDGNILTIDKSKVINADNEYVEHSTKTVESTRSIMIPDDLAKLIKDKNGKVFTQHPNSIGKWLTNTQEKLGIEKFSMHKLRHFFCSTLSDMNVPEADILKMGGWSKDAKVMKTVYRHSQLNKDKERQKNIASQIGNLF